MSLLLREYESSDADWLWQTNAPTLLPERLGAFRARDRPPDRGAGGPVAPRSAQAGAARRPGRRAARPPRAEAMVARKEAFTRARRRPSRRAARSSAIELSARPTFNKQGRFIGYHGVGSDVTAARQAADRIAHMARHDALTGLPNRLQLLENLGAALTGGAGARARMRDPAGRSRPLQDDQRQPRPCRRRSSAPAGVAQLRDGDLRRDDRRPARRRRIRDRRARRSKAARSWSSSAWRWSARCRARSSIATSACSSAPRSASPSARATATASRK